MSVFPVHHRSHDYGLLVKEWKSFAKLSDLKMQTFAMAGDHAVHVITSAKLQPRTVNGEPATSIYISAGVHGDEPAPPWALLEWARDNTELMKSHRFLIFPCLNPHGLIHNTRVDHRGVDINRTFHDEGGPLIAAWRKVIDKHKFSVALYLHEDYDAQGVYVYELNRNDDIAGHRILEDCARIMPLDGRVKIDGRKADRGLINRKRVPLDLPGMPEAIVLYQMGTPVTMTFESPSEFSLEARIAVQKKFIESSLHHVVGI